MAIDTTGYVDLIRHGEPAGGEMYRGHKDDPLSEKGWQQMHAAIQTGDRWDRILTSPLRRCREFAEQLGKQHGSPVDICEGFKEMCFGDWEGLTRAEVDTHFGDLQQRFWQDAERHPPSNSEPMQDFHARIGTAWQTYQPQQGERILLVCHGGVIRMLLAHVLGLTPSLAMAGFRVPYANRSRLKLDAHAAKGGLRRWQLAAHGNTNTGGA